MKMSDYLKSSLSFVIAGTILAFVSGLFLSYLSDYAKKEADYKKYKKIEEQGEKDKPRDDEIYHLRKQRRQSNRPQIAGRLLFYTA